MNLNQLFYSGNSVLNARNIGSENHLYTFVLHFQQRTYISRVLHIKHLFRDPVKFWARLDCKPL